jgi:outer membrane protein TolC
MIVLALLCVLLAAPAWGQEVGSRPSWPLGLTQREPQRAISVSDSDAPSADVLTLEEAVALALKQNRHVKNAALDVEKVGDQIASTKTLRLPQFQVSVTPAYSLIPIDVTFPAGAFGNSSTTGPIPATETTLRTNPQYSTAATIGVSQPVSQLYKLGLAIDQLGVAQDLSRQDLRAQRQGTVNQVKRAYYAVLQSQSTAEALQEHVASSRDLVRVVTDQLAQRAALRADLLQAQAALAKAEYAVTATQRDLASRKEQLNHLLGRAPDTPVQVSAVPPAITSQTDLKLAQEVALRQRPELTRAGLGVTHADYDLRIKKAEFIPDVNLVFQYRSAITSDVLPKNIAYVGVQINWDVWDWGKKQDDLALRRRTLDQAKNAVAETTSQVILDVNAAFRKMEDSQAYLTVTQLNREATREKLRVVTEQYREQSVLLPDVLSAQAALAQANDQYRRAVLNFWETRADFERALGTE